MKTLAVVIGIDAYTGNAKLNSAVNDATAIADVFKRLGYEVIFRTDCNREQCGEVMDEFTAKIKDFEASLFYFAGHGFQVQGENFLASTECQVQMPTVGNCNYTCIRLNELLDIYKRHSEKLHIAIIDACRKSFDRGASGTFTPVQAPKGTLIAFSTSPNEGAKDYGGKNGHSIYTGSLLKYIGREYLSVEKLFKNVRKTVYSLTDGTQTPWEHTSLIGDFYFNTGQLVHSIQIPYDESVVKDAGWKGKSDRISQIIRDLKVRDFYKQNDTMDLVSGLKARDLDKNHQFLLGRNILQASGAAFGAVNFLRDAKTTLLPFMTEKENHVLNGILFEIYFDKHGNFRKGNFKLHNIDQVLALRHEPKFSASFQFIKEVLQPYKDHLFYIPDTKDEIVDVNIQASPVAGSDFSGNAITQTIIEKVTVGTKDITEEIRGYSINGENESELKTSLKHLLVAPEEVIHLHHSVPLVNIVGVRQLQPAAVSNW